ncbi:hypothetical protein [Ereboglobus luteus]|uniref:hypothetical protein n=1 Tax=Ereboglobus luteus TaxID=1796921 RepID=UPI0012603699|nr:hypothetical protein [Ereboglobus luteus]
MKHNRRLLVLFIVAIISAPLSTATLSAKSIKIPPTVFKIVDEDTGRPIEGIKLRLLWCYSQPRFRSGMAKNISMKKYCSEDYTSDKNGMVSLSGKTIHSFKYGDVFETYWVNLSEYFNEYTLGKGHMNLFDKESAHNPNKTYGGIILHRTNRDIHVKSYWDISKPGNALVWQQWLKRDASNETEAIVLKLRLRDNSGRFYPY